ncbi:RHS domain-containing protein [Acidovorax sp. SUPP2825]|uniref:RHS domain-containing protein n=1 Tax=Acidovorax sp. SUPP2825 TaxID=2920879 RepID=UPI0023DE5738|nr:RHS domain-containing protein [Acidovorax sp. SUPP2825]GKS97606.1 hypothetical protein AVAK2825_23745 [Acidovorax sp. SUPP2825]
MEGLRLLQERRGGQCSSYVYEPGSYTPLARIDGQGALEPEHPASALALGDVDTARGKEHSVPTTNGEWADAHHAVAGPVGGLARKLAALDKAQAAQPQPVVMENSPPTPSLAGAINVNERSAAPGARIYYFHTQANGLPEEMSDRNGNLVWRAQYRAWGSAIAGMAGVRFRGPPGRSAGCRKLGAGESANGGGAAELEDARAVPGSGNGVALQHVPVLRPRPGCVHDA